MIKIPMVEFIKTNEFNNIIKFIELYNKRIVSDLNCSDTFTRLNLALNIEEYLRSYNTPFFDMLVDSIVIKNNNYYMHIGLYTKQMNIFLKSIFLRVFWNQNSSNPFPDKFVEFIWNNYKTDSNFVKLEQEAIRIYNNSNTILDFLKDFMYNDNYEYIKQNDIISIFNCLDNLGVHKSNDTGLYLLPKGLVNSINNIEDDTSTDTLLKKMYFYTKILPVLKNINTKFNYIPPKFSKDNKDSIFQGNFLITKNKEFIPQLLLFFNEKHK